MSKKRKSSSKSRRRQPVKTDNSSQISLPLPDVGPQMIEPVQSSSKPSYMPWVVLGLVVVVILSLVIYFLVWKPSQPAQTFSTSDNLVKTLINQEKPKSAESGVLQALGFRARAIREQDTYSAYSLDELKTQVNTFLNNSPHLSSSQKDQAKAKITQLLNTTALNDSQKKGFLIFLAKSIRALDVYAKIKQIILPKMGFTLQDCRQYTSSPMGGTPVGTAAPLSESYETTAEMAEVSSTTSTGQTSSVNTDELVTQVQFLASQLMFKEASKPNYNADLVVAAMILTLICGSITRDIPFSSVVEEIPVQKLLFKGELREELKRMATTVGLNPQTFEQPMSYPEISKFIVFFLKSPNVSLSNQNMKFCIIYGLETDVTPIPGTTTEIRENWNKKNPFLWLRAWKRGYI